MRPSCFTAPCNCDDLRQRYPCIHCTIDNLIVLFLASALVHTAIKEVAVYVSNVSHISLSSLKIYGVAEQKAEQNNETNSSCKISTGTSITLSLHVSREPFPQVIQSVELLQPLPSISYTTQCTACISGNSILSIKYSPRPSSPISSCSFRLIMKCRSQSQCQGDCCFGGKMPKSTFASFVPRSGRVR
jgi:hypothetical protein